MSQVFPFPTQARNPIATAILLISLGLAQSATAQDEGAAPKVTIAAAYTAEVTA